jgi:hypothetical protein
LTSDLQFLATGLGSARAQELLLREENPSLAKDLDVKDVPFWTPVRIPSELHLDLPLN